MAARQQDPDLAGRYLRRLREAFATEARNVNDRDEQVERSSPPRVRQSVADDGVLCREPRGNGLFWHAVGGGH